MEVAAFVAFVALVVAWIALPLRAPEVEVLARGRGRLSEAEPFTSPMR